MDEFSNGHDIHDTIKYRDAFPKDYKLPKEWVGLTVQERNDCLVEADPCECLAGPEAEELMCCIEAKLKEKNT